MSTQIRKCLSLAPNAAVDAAGNSTAPDDLRQVMGEVVATGTRWVKIWAQWHLMVPDGHLAWNQIGDPALNPNGYKYVAALDAQVAAARAQNPKLGVVIQSIGFPRWTNGTVGKTINDFPVYDTRAVDSQGNLVGAPKLIEYKTPDSVAPDAGWGHWVAFLMVRYQQHGCGVIIDLLNEPNLQWWPQRMPSTTSNPWDPGYSPLVACKAAEMMAVAQNIAAFWGYTTPFMAPGTSDLEGPGTGYRRYHTNYLEFNTGVLDRLQQLNFTASNQFIWSHHNYQDCLNAPAVPLRVANVRNGLTGRWAGWRGAERPDVPNIWITEGGAKPAQVGGSAGQSSAIRHNWIRLSGATGDGAGVEMMTQYLMYSAPAYDTGLREPVAAGGAPRPALGEFTSWAGRA